MRGKLKRSRNTDADSWAIEPCPYLRINLILRVLECLPLSNLGPKPSSRLRPFSFSAVPTIEAAISNNFLVPTVGLERFLLATSGVAHFLYQVITAHDHSDDLASCKPP